MADFNPFREWLGVSAPGQPPDHYALLGLKRFEDDVGTIRRAADAQKSRVRSVRPGPHAAEWSRILDQLDAARDCLATPDKKAAYDSQLRNQPPPEESVLDDPTEQAPTAASSIVADSADSEAVPAADQQSSASDEPRRANQPLKNLLPPGFGPESKSDRDLPLQEPEPTGPQPVESLTKNILPPTFGPQQPAPDHASPAPTAGTSNASPPASRPSASSPSASNPTVPGAVAPSPSSPITNPAPVVEAPSTPTAQTTLPQNPAPIAASPSAPAASPSAPAASPSAPTASPSAPTASPSAPTASPSAPAAPQAPLASPMQVGGQPPTAPASGNIPAPQTTPAPLAPWSQPQPQLGERDDDDLLPPMAIPLAAASPGSTPYASVGAPDAAHLASPLPVNAAPTGTPLSGAANGAAMGGPVAGGFNQLTGPSYGDAFGAADPGSGSASPQVTAQTPSARAAVGRSKLSASSLVAVAASLVMLLAAGGIFVRNRLANQQNPEVSRLDGSGGPGGSQPGSLDGGQGVDRPTQTQPAGTANTTDGGIGNDPAGKNVRPATFEQPIDDPSPMTPLRPIDEPSPSPAPMPSPRPAPSSDPSTMPNLSPMPDPGAKPDQIAVVDPGPKPDPGATPDPGARVEPSATPDRGLTPSPPLIPADPPPSGPPPSDPAAGPGDSPADPTLNPTPEPMPEPAPMPEPEPALSEKLMIDFNWTLKEVRGHLAERDLYTAKVLIGRAKEIAKKGKPGPHMEKLERLELLTHYVDEFWGAVLDGLPELEGKDLEVGSTVVHIQQVSQNTIAYRAQGRNFKKQRYEWPSGLVRAIAENWLDKKPKSKIFVGAFMAVDKSYGIEKAREQWQKALTGDAETVEAVQKVMPVLNEL